jgi:hypothetical protein
VCLSLSCALLKICLVCRQMAGWVGESLLRWLARLIPSPRHIAVVLTQPHCKRSVRVKDMFRRRKTLHSWKVLWTTGSGLERWSSVVVLVAIRVLFSTYEHVESFVATVRSWAVLTSTTNEWNDCILTTCEGMDNHLLWTGPFLLSDGFQLPPILSTDHAMVPQLIRIGVSWICIATCNHIGYVLIFLISLIWCRNYRYISFVSNMYRDEYYVFSATYVVMEVTNLTD